MYWLSTNYVKKIYFEKCKYFLMWWFEESIIYLISVNRQNIWNKIRANGPRTVEIYPLKYILMPYTNVVRPKDELFLMC